MVREPASGVGVVGGGGGSLFLLYTFNTLGT